jgi:Spy/CpxP family protein refolding chaperone
MKKLIYLVVCMLLMGTMADGQRNDSTRHEKDKTRLKGDSTAKTKLKDEGRLKDLNLNDDQKKSLDSIHTETRKQKGAIENDKSLTDAQKQEKIKALNKKEKSKMNSLLTPEQREKVKQIKEDKKKKEGGSGSSGQ